MGDLAVEAIDESVRMLLDGVEVKSIHELKQLVDIGRSVLDGVARAEEAPFAADAVLLEGDLVLTVMHRDEVKLWDEGRYARGYLDGLAAYAWWKNGEQYVGTTGTTLKDAIAKARDTWNYFAV